MKQHEKAAAAEAHEFIDTITETLTAQPFQIHPEFESFIKTQKKCLRIRQI